MIKNFEDIYKNIAKQFINIENNKPCIENVVFIGLDHGLSMDILIFINICYAIVKQYNEDYIYIEKKDIKIPKSQLKKITYFINFDYMLSEDPLLYLQYEYKDDYINKEYGISVCDPKKINLLTNSNI